ncbi:hypothetical protein PSHI8_12660 [Polynucleobacter sp. SHI8]|uniref:hypothetical protein n=1 Tax=unclassified Polynucleobacter TaxID=2640945 RepID=UPI002492CA0C|nr:MULTISPECIES: hypothetical protein [unclassified Polynucleobacter]BDW11184.1 hypothetical protein PSHI2_12660 [Polynucleobacter sp. SHI2]BDW13630.1 hypothetical protein PSHI8_12660 [Polynucleobacter sp. SHI8]
MPNHSLFFASFLLLLTLHSQVHAGVSQDKELQQIDLIQNNLNTQFEWIQYRYDQAVSECYGKFWMQRCMDKARIVFLKEKKIVRDQEIALHDRQRVVNEIIKDEKDQQRMAEYQDPQKVKERAENRANYEEKQRLRAEREAELEERRKDADKRAKENRKTSPLD